MSVPICSAPPRARRVAMVPEFNGGEMRAGGTADAQADQVAAIYHAHRPEIGPGTTSA